jgi:aquaporin Z
MNMTWNARVLVAEAIGTFMLVASVLGPGLFATAAPANALGVAISIGLTVMALTYALGHISGGHFNPAVTLGLVAGGRFDSGRALGFIIAQCVGGILAATAFVTLIGTGRAANLAGVANGYGALSAAGSSLGSVFITEVIVTAFFLIVVMSVTSRRAPAGFAPIAIGLASTAIYLMTIPISNGSANPARSLATALYGGSAALGQVWLFWVAPILGAVIGGVIARYLQEE